MIISPSIASANPLRLEEEVKRLGNGTYYDFHIDIEDGNFIPNITFGFKTIKALRMITDVPFSFHLMVNRPQDYIEEVLCLNPSIIFAHVEALDYIGDFLEKVHKHGVKAGLAFNPKTAVESYLYALEEADGVLIMTSEPDGRGQQFIPNMIVKVKAISRLDPLLQVWVDGGITSERLDLLKEAGATHVVMGRQIFSE